MPLSNIPAHIAAKFPFTASLKREAVAIRDLLLPTRTYSQCGEDRSILDFFGPALASVLREAIYFEVGANQPSQLSNSYLFYRNGGSGILVEPDERCSRLLRRYRPRDIVINALAGADSGAGWLYLQKNTVFNSSVPGGKRTAIGQKLLSRVSLDDLWRAIHPSPTACYCFLLSVDTEGGEEQIIQGATELIQNSYFICLEHHGVSERKEVFLYLLGPEFSDYHETALNVLFKRREDFSRFRQRTSGTREAE
jgi:hypothetical protein